MCPNCMWPDVRPWWATCGGVYFLTWTLCADAARRELLLIMTSQRGWGTALLPGGNAASSAADDAGITARSATHEDRERWAAMVRQQQDLQALEAT